MSASPELSRTAAAEFVPRPIVTVRSVEDLGRILSPENHDDDDGEECRTPTSEESKLPVITWACPPAPRKLRRVVGCKRKLSELEFFRVEQEEVERLFRRRDQPSLVPLKRRKRYSLGD